jgi:hypothetical protein
VNEEELQDLTNVELGQKWFRCDFLALSTMTRSRLVRPNFDFRIATPLTGYHGRYVCLYEPVTRKASALLPRRYQRIAWENSSRALSEAKRSMRSLQTAPCLGFPGSYITIRSDAICSSWWLWLQRAIRGWDTNYIRSQEDRYSLVHIVNQFSSISYL